ncbi:cupin domain-containing protein [candidate division KSB1 bacterium]|nr:cupin domain-containing protein [candidate division KSB1 bacterium]
MEKISLEKMAELIKSPFTPLDVFRVNNTAVRLVKIHGKYHMHKHSDQDELFIVLRGQVHLNFEDRTVVLDEGEGFLVKKGVEHQSHAEKEALVLMVEPYDTVPKGD